MHDAHDGLIEIQCFHLTSISIFYYLPVYLKSGMPDLVTQIEGAR
jgi:hypothetical protein